MIPAPAIKLHTYLLTYLLTHLNEILNSEENVVVSECTVCYRGVAYYIHVHSTISFYILFRGKTLH